MVWNVAGSLPLRQRLENDLGGLHTVVENDAIALARYVYLFWDRLELEELTLKTDEGSTPAIRPEDFVTVLITDQGIGGGFILDGKVYAGPSGLAGELGHMRLYWGQDALECRCGRQGCVEAYAAPHGLLGRLNHTYMSLDDAAEAKDPETSRIFAEGGATLGLAISYANSPKRSDRSPDTGSTRPSIRQCNSASPTASAAFGRL
jgi:predicted NBD/HSP70 family sugar kinase